MARIGIRELRQHASRWVARAAAGETIEITDRGRLVAALGPPPRGNRYERLVGTGEIRPPEAVLPGSPPPEAAEPLTPHLEAEREDRV
ncbi:MAG TPA: type II toxin-antitoxin system prevent-host-death family antitoxin [Jiangellales bacterium]|nr:type II toxin-antitoxin system prevent-host-death family antitoxin [Jiangellales bacterium]